MPLEMLLKRVGYPGIADQAPRIALALFHRERAEDEVAHFGMRRVKRVTAEVEERAIDVDRARNTADFGCPVDDERTLAERKARADTRRSGTEHEHVGTHSHPITRTETFPAAADPGRGTTAILPRR